MVWQRFAWALVAGLALLAFEVGAQGRLPCSGSKGGIEGCVGDRFLCWDGSVSASKRSCRSYTGATGNAPRPAVPAAPRAAGGDCSCRSEAVCVGPKGGRYCITDSGKKSYYRR